MKNTFLILLISIFVFASCKKDKNDSNCAISEANFAGNYKISSIKYKASASSTEQDYTDVYLEACEKDDILTLNTDHTYIYTDAGTVCDPNGSYDGIWGLSGNTLSVDGDPATIENFSCSGFSAFASDFNTTGDKLTFTYSKQ